MQLLDNQTTTHAAVCEGRYTRNITHYPFSLQVFCEPSEKVLIPSASTHTGTRPTLKRQMAKSREMKGGLLTVLKLGNRPTGEEFSTGKVMKGFMSRPDCIIREGVRTNVGSVLLWQELPGEEKEGENQNKETKLKKRTKHPFLNSLIHRRGKQEKVS